MRLCLLFHIYYYQPPNNNPFHNQMRTTNHFDPSDHLSNIDQNQFLLAPSRLTYSTGKDELIKKLQEKNQRLMTEIQKVEKVLTADPGEKTVYGNKLPEINSKATQQQLQNAYKQIKTYEYEIKKLRGITKEGSYVQQVKKNETLLKQKQQMAQRLRKQLADIKKQSMELTKFLTNDNKKQEIETKNVKLNSQIKWLREKLRELEMKQNMNKDNRDKQLTFIKKLESNLVEQGFPIGTIRVLRQKFTPAKENPNQSYYSSTANANARRSASKTTPNNRSYAEQLSQKQQIIEDRTPQAYTALQGEIKLLMKMEKDYQNQANVLEKEREDAAKANLVSRNKLLEVQDEIQKTEARIVQLKKSIDPSKIKPNRGLSMPNTSRYGDINRSLGSINKAAFQHLFRHQEIGKVSKQGRRFADRIKLAKSQAKIVAIDFYQSKEGPPNIVGIQATYQVNKSIKKGPLNMISDPKQTTKRTITLFDSTDFFRTIECVCNEKGLIIGLTLVSNKGVAGKGGCLEGVRRPLNLGKGQYPVCLYGSFGETGLEMFGTEVLEDKGN